MSTQWEYDDITFDWDDEDDGECPTCNGTGRVNPLTPGLPEDFLCLGSTECPRCDGTGEI